MATDATTCDVKDQKNQDINEAFTDIAQTEEKIASEGFQEGYSSGSKTGEVEGYHLGYHRGAELGAELGYYKGVVEAWIAIGNKEEGAVSPRAKTHLHKLNEVLNNFPHTNTEDEDILALAESVRASFKKVCSLLKFDGNYPEATKLTF